MFLITPHDPFLLAQNDIYTHRRTRNDSSSEILPTRTSQTSVMSIDPQKTFLLQEKYLNNYYVCYSTCYALQYKV